MTHLKINIIAALIILLCTTPAAAQEIQAKVTVNASRVGPGVDKRIFNTLQAALNTFINNRKWSDKAFTANEKIDCNFTLVVTDALEPNVYKATLAIQAARPIYNTSYKSPMINFVDEKVAFKYLEFQAIDFNENRVQGSDALVANLPAVLAYYINLILGFDFDSYNLKAGENYFLKAQSIVNNAPQNATIEGWKAFDGQRNRYWLSENLTNSKYVVLHDVVYNYYRKAMDFMYENESQARQEMITCLTLLNNLQKENTSTTNMVIPFFVQSKTNEFVNLFKKAEPIIRQQAVELLRQIDVINASKYSEELK